MLPAPAGPIVAMKQFCALGIVNIVRERPLMVIVVIIRAGNPC